jgi:hypothetical protein
MDVAPFCFANAFAKVVRQQLWTMRPRCKDDQETIVCLVKHVNQEKVCQVFKAEAIWNGLSFEDIDRFLCTNPFEHAIYDAAFRALLAEAVFRRP